MQKDQQSLHAAVRALAQHDAVQAAFALDRDGALVAWSGRAPGFSPTGQFPTLEKGKEPDQNLYLTLVGGYYLGVIFADGVPLEQVRPLIEEQEASLVEAMGLAPRSEEPTP